MFVYNVRIMSLHIPGLPSSVCLCDCTGNVTVFLFAFVCESCGYQGLCVCVCAPARVCVCVCDCVCVCACCTPECVGGCMFVLL